MDWVMLDDDCREEQEQEVREHLEAHGYGPDRPQSAAEISFDDLFARANALFRQADGRFRYVDAYIKACEDTK